MMCRLAAWSTEDKERKFDRLLRLVADKAWLSEAARITLASSGARTPGVDGVDKRMMEAHLHDELATITLHRRSAISVDRKLGRPQFQCHAVDMKPVLARSYEPQRRRDPHQSLRLVRHKC